MKKNIKSIFQKFIFCALSLMMVFNITAFNASAEGISDPNESVSPAIFPFVKTMYVGQVRFTGQNTGSWKSLDDKTADHLRVRVSFKPVDGISTSTQLYVSVYQYLDVYRGELVCNDWDVSPDSNGYYTFTSPYFSISKNSDVRLKYLATSSGTTYSPRTVDCKVWYDYY